MVPRYGWYSPVTALTASNTASCTIAASRAWANGFSWFATAVLTAIAFQSDTTSAVAIADPNNVVTINKNIGLKVPCILLLCVLFIAILRTFPVLGRWHHYDQKLFLSIARRVSRH